MDRVKTREGLRKKHWVNGGKVVNFSRATVTRWSDYSLYVHMKKERAESKLNVIFIILVPGREITMHMLSTSILRITIVIIPGAVRNMVCLIFCEPLENP
jgi:uncharacterized membrane protein YccF (DUF307 family)